MKENIYLKFLNTVKNHALLEKGDNIIVGLSGGADSVCLLLLLIEYNKRESDNTLRLVAVHYNHCIRGAEADADELFCEKLCNSLGVEFVARRGDVPSYAENHKMSVEEAARSLRYECFDSVARELFCDEAGGCSLKIAVAHNLDDRIETVLHNIARGTALEGLKGIAYSRGHIVRPILDLSRKETEAVCNEFGISYRTDSTNNEDTYTRNKIRNRILPYLNEAFGGDFSSGLLSLSELASEDNEYIKMQAEKHYAAVSEKLADGTVKINGTEFRKLHPVIAKRVVRIALSEVECGRRFFEGFVGIDRKMTERIYEHILKNRGGGFVIAAKSVICVKAGNNYYLGSKELLMPEQNTDAGDVGEAEYVVFSPQNGVASGHKIKNSDGTCIEVTASVINGEENVKTAKELCKKSNNSAVIFDFDEISKLKSPLVIRTKRTGDRFSPLGSRGGKPLRRFLTDMKIPSFQRDNLLLLAKENEILHIFNYRRSNFASVQEACRCAIMVRIEKSEE